MEKYHKEFAKCFKVKNLLMYFYENRPKFFGQLNKIGRVLSKYDQPAVIQHMISRSFKETGKTRVILFAILLN